MKKNYNYKVLKKGNNVNPVCAPVQTHTHKLIYKLVTAEPHAEE